LSRSAYPHPERVSWFKTLRVATLLLILLVVALTTWLDHYRSTRWRQPLFVAIYPIAADESPVTRNYVDSLDGERFKAIDLFFSRSGALSAADERTHQITVASRTHCPTAATRRASRHLFHRRMEFETALLGMER